MVEDSQCPPQVSTGMHVRTCTRAHAPPHTQAYIHTICTGTCTQVSTGMLAHMYMHSPPHRHHARTHTHAPIYKSTYKHRITGTYKRKNLQKGTANRAIEPRLTRDNRTKVRTVNQLERCFCSACKALGLIPATSQNQLQAHNHSIWEVRDRGIKRARPSLAAAAGLREAWDKTFCL